MEPLIKFRLLTSQLKQNELQNFMQQIIHNFGVEKIISFIFNHFLLKYNQSQQHQDDLGHIINIISNILIARQNKKRDEQNDENILPLSIDLMPSEMIKECASYLDVMDYLNFSKSNRKVYVSCNSPSKLQRLFTSKYPKYHECNLNQFISIKSLQLIPSQFNEYITLHSEQKQFYQLTSLYLVNECKNNHEDLQTFMNIKCINFANMIHLGCWGFGDKDNLYDFDSFCEILLKFPNLTELYLENIFLTEFNAENEIIAKLLPNLSILEVFEPASSSVNLLRNELINNYSNQIVSLSFDEGKMDIVDTSFPKIKEIVLYDPNIDTIIHKIGSVERFYFEIPGSSQRIFSEVILSNMINTMLTKFTKLNWIHLNSNFDKTQRFMKDIEITLSNPSSIDLDELTLVFSINDDIVNDQINLHIAQIIHALDASNINDYMLGVHGSIKGENGFNIISDRFKETHLVHTSKFHEFESIIISNKDCKINGYSTRWIKKIHG